jgi:hypothetical protein
MTRDSLKKSNYKISCVVIGFIEIKFQPNKNKVLDHTRWWMMWCEFTFSWEINTSCRGTDYRYVIRTNWCRHCAIHNDKWRERYFRTHRLHYTVVRNKISFKLWILHCFRAYIFFKLQFYFIHRTRVIFFQSICILLVYLNFIGSLPSDKKCAFIRPPNSSRC